ncbi:MAG TPA: VPDSG-CTERM sorting domain-containing protein [Verrucomicrobiae bacterium]|nr:VPDSG-CTERM sorting domain-containing protein [Verrucomicrobiae bacterium]
MTSVSGISLTVSLAGTVMSTVAGLDPTAFIGNFTVQDPSAATGGKFYYTESISFSNVPDSGSTLLLMGIAAGGLVLARRRWGIMV